MTEAEEAKLRQYREALESCRQFFDVIACLRAVEGPDVRFVRKAKMHCLYARADVIAALDGKTHEQVLREMMEQSVNEQPSDKAW